MVVRAIQIAELNAGSNGMTNKIGKAETAIDMLEEKIKWIDERDEEEEETQVLGRKRQRVVKVIPKKNPDHLRQDMLLAERARIHREAEE